MIISMDEKSFIKKTKYKHIEINYKMSLKTCRKQTNKQANNNLTYRKDTPAINL